MPTPISQRSLAALRALNIAAASAADTCHRTARDLAQSLTQKCGTKPMAHSSARCKTNPIEANEKPLCQPQNEENDATAATAGCKTNPFAESIGLLPIGERNPMAHSSARSNVPSAPSDQSDALNPLSDKQLMALARARARGPAGWREGSKLAQR